MAVRNQLFQMEEYIMNKHFRIGKALILALNLSCAFIMTTTAASAAYLDPATSGYVVQIIAGIVIACGTALAIFWNKITRKFRKEKVAEAPVENLRTEDAAGGAVITADDLLDDDN